MKEGRIRPSLVSNCRTRSSSASSRNEGGSNSTLVDATGRSRNGNASCRNEGGSNSTLVVVVEAPPATLD